MLAEILFWMALAAAIVTASNLVKIDGNGKPLGEDRIDSGGFLLHGAIHKAHPDVACIIHLHTTAGVAVASLRDDLLPLSQTAMVLIEDLAYADYLGIGQGDDLISDLLGDKNCLKPWEHCG